MRMRGCWRWVVVMGVMVGAAPARGAEVATTEQMRRWVAGLMDVDPGVREQSRAALMGLSREELGALAAVVNDFRPLEAPLVQVLKDVVEHVYLTGSEYEQEEKGFLGITMPVRIEQTARLEVVVESRMPGFVGYRMLQDGDAILDIEEHPLAQPAERNVFCDVVRTIRPGRVVHFKVLRRGRVVRVPIQLDPRPKDKTGVAFEYEGRVQELLAQRAAEAEAFWKRAFEGERTATVEQK